MVATAVLLVGLVALSGFFSGSEIALFSISHAKARALAEEGRRGAQALLRLKSNPDHLLITILVGNNIANILAASIATYAATRAVGSAGVGLATGVITLLVLFFGEITPKSFAVANATRISLAAAPVLEMLSRALFFLVVPLEALTRALLPKRGPSGPRITEGEIRSMTQLGHASGTIEEHERLLIERVFTLDTTQAWEVMTPRVEIFAWNEARKLSEVTRELRTVPFSRIPVFAESLDDITGVLYARDAYQALIAGQRDVPLRSLAREPLFVPESVTLIQLLRDFQSRRIHMGIVVDEHGGTDGLLTLEDILEELVGEIIDEVDVPEEMIVRVSRNEILVNGAADLREINHFFNTSLPLLEHRSLNGYLLQEFGRVPDALETIDREGIRIQVLEATDTLVARARLTRLAMAAEQDSRPGTDGR
jgi:putative hemolysin